MAMILAPSFFRPLKRNLLLRLAATAPLTYHLLGAPQSLDYGRDSAEVRHSGTNALEYSAHLCGVNGLHCLRRTTYALLYWLWAPWMIVYVERYYWFSLIVIIIYFLCSYRASNRWIMINSTLSGNTGSLLRQKFKSSFT